MRFEWDDYSWSELSTFQDYIQLFGQDRGVWDCLGGW